MSRSFFTAEKQVDLYNGSNVFSALITAAPTAYGLVAGQATAYAALNSTYAAAYLLALAPETRTKGTIAARNDAADLLRDMARDLASIIDGMPVTTEQRIALGLNVRKTPAPKAPPGAPTALKAVLNQDGSMDLAWKCDTQGATGTLYQVYRRDVPAGEFAYLGGSGQRKYLDATIPAGTTEVTYMIQGVRSTIAGPWGLFTVTCGAGVAGATTVTQSAAPASPKLAA